MSRYQEASQELLNLLKEIIEDYFPELENVMIKVLMDTKKRKSNGEYKFASTRKMKDSEKYLSADEKAPNGYDYLMIVDKNIFENIPTEDKTKVLFHDLCHIFIQPDAKDPCKTVEHFINFLFLKLS